MVLHVIFHIHKEKTEKKVHLKGTGTFPVVPHILRKPNMLQKDKIPDKGSPVEPGQNPKKDGQPASRKGRPQDKSGINRQNRPGRPVEPLKSGT